jgi:AAA15 family ATPase/GTPase
MKITKFQVKNYQSIKDTGVIELSENDNLSIFAGQNESGKSSILKALNAFEQNEFSGDDIPFESGEKDSQEVSVTYKVIYKDVFFNALNDEIGPTKGVSGEDVVVFDKSAINKIDEFTITRKVLNGVSELTIDDLAFNVIKNSICEKPQSDTSESEKTETVTTDPGDDLDKKKELAGKKYFELANDENTLVAKTLFDYTPRIVFFDDLCDVLPDKILVTDLKNKNTKADGYQAVRNFEAQTGELLSKKENLPDGKRITSIERENNEISVNFQKDWGQRIHGNNSVKIRYDFQTRADDKSYVCFFVETKEGVLLPVRQRSKGLVWFLSLWLELNTRSKKYSNLVLLLDEPDQHLHVRAQEDILKLMKKLSGDGVQVMCATHSPYLLETEHLNRIKLVINDEENGTVAEDITTAKIDSRHKVDALKPIADAIGLHASDLSPLQKKNVLFEGVSDFNYYLGMRELLKRGDKYGMIPGIGLRKVNSLISLCIGYGFTWLAIMDDDPSAGGVDTKTKYEEVKDKVFDGDDVEAKKHIHITTGITGVENMFELDDLKLTGVSFAGTSKDNCIAVGKGRKITCSKLFLEKVRSGDIKESDLSEKCKKNFTEVFDFIDANLS